VAGLFSVRGSGRASAGDRRRVGDSDDAGMEVRDSIRVQTQRTEPRLDLVESPD
jgi:hypothetical protein